MAKTPSVIHWFRLDLRIHDNLALRNAINEAENRKHLLRPVYVIDPDIKNKVGVNRLRFLLQSLQDLDSNLRKLNSRLFVLRGTSLDLLPKLFDEWQVKYLTTQLDIDADIVSQDEAIDKVAEEKDIFIVRRVQHTVYDVHSVLKKNNGAVPLTYQKFLSLVNDIQVKDTIEITKILSDHCKPPDSDSKEYDIPSLEDLGVEAELHPYKYPGGETEALNRLNTYMAKKQWVCKFEKPNTSPNSIEPSTTVLSPYISHGCLSSKLFYHKLKEVENGMPHSEPPVSLMGQLMWREFYYTAGAGIDNFDKMVGNPVCTQIPWGKNEEHLKAWAEGKTGYPFVDAIMRQLKQEGWIHHLARHMVACFLTRGDLWISWEEGAKVFEDYLLDYDWSLNAGNWMCREPDAANSPSTRSSTSSWSEEPALTNMDISTGHMVLAYMEDHLRNKDRLEQEWRALCAYEAEPCATTAALKSDNAGKNRYADVLPYDHSRVTLNTLSNHLGSDYINASTITDHDPRNPAYIAAAGPLAHTAPDFWQMVWEQGSVVMVMLTRLTENGQQLCHRYWPEEGSELYHIYEVHLVSEHIWCDDYLVRSFYLKNQRTGETRTVTQFHFLSWPENGVPSSTKALLEFRRKVNKSYRGRSCPIVVHCSDGAGRSGTYCLIDMVLNRMAKGAKEIDIAATLEHIRDQRPRTVATKQQFEFVLMAVAEEVHAILKALPAHLQQLQEKKDKEKEKEKEKEKDGNDKEKANN